MVFTGLILLSTRLVNSTGTPNASPTQTPIKPDKTGYFFDIYKKEEGRRKKEEGEEGEEREEREEKEEGEEREEGRRK
ncbi:MAG: hypothetical protein ACRCT1_14080 [Microcoleaceae cyanobacterium]